MTGLKKIIRGRLVRFCANPFSAVGSDALEIVEKGAVLIDAGKVVAMDEAQALASSHPTAPVVDHSDCLLMAGFVDGHMHYPQIDIIGAVNNGLADWLERYAFPQEMKFGDEAFTRASARFGLEGMFRNGITSAGVFGTVHKASIDVFFEEAARHDALMIAGKVCMDENAPAPLLDTPKASYDDTKALIDRWQGEGRARYAITPRFAITSSRDQLEALGALRAEYPGVLVQTHLSETRDEVATVREQFPERADYLDVYDHYGLAGAGANFGHGIHLTDRELAHLSEQGGAVAHCPTSNAFLGSGVFNLLDTLKRSPGLEVSLATDVGGGTSLSMFRTMRAAYQAGRHHGANLTPAQLFYLATIGGARAFGESERIGNVQVGGDADLIAIDPRSTPMLTRLSERAETVEDVLMSLIMQGDDRAIKSTYIAGEPVYDRAA